MKIGILGAGNMGGTLGRLWTELRHEVFFGLRDAESVKAQRALSAVENEAGWGTAAEAAEFAEIILIAVPWEATQEVVESIAPRLAGKVLIDCTNPIKPDLSGLAVGHTTSAAEEISRWAPGARVVKAFNTVGASTLHDAKYGDHSASVFVCGDDDPAKKMVTQLAEEIGFEVIDAGPLIEARYLEPLAMLWIHLAIRGKFGSKIAVKLLRR
ncbi:MAG: NADPH-dependent F420 reductase [Pirellulales bacterium]